MTYACPAWEFTADSYLLKLQRLQNKVLHTTGNLPGCTPHRDLHMAFKIPHLYDFVTKLCRQQATAILSHENIDFRIIGHGEALHRKYKRWRSGVQSISCLDSAYILEQYMYIEHNLLYKAWTAGLRR
jgi:hypothetical protein